MHQAPDEVIIDDPATKREYSKLRGNSELKGISKENEQLRKRALIRATFLSWYCVKG